MVSCSAFGCSNSSKNENDSSFISIPYDRVAVKEKKARVAEKAQPANTGAPTRGVAAPSAPPATASDHHRQSHQPWLTLANINDMVAYYLVSGMHLLAANYSSFLVCDVDIIQHSYTNVNVNCVNLTLFTSALRNHNFTT